METLLSNPATLLVGGGAAAVIVGLWGHIKGFFAYLKSFVLISASMTDGSTNAVMAYARKHWQVSRHGPRTYSAWNLFVRPRRRREWVGMEVIGKETRLFWKGWLPIWITRTSNTGKSTDQTDEHVLYMPIRISFFRGTVNLDNLLTEALAYFNKSYYETSDESRRYRIRYIHGSGSKPANFTMEDSAEGRRPYYRDDGNDELLRARGNRILNLQHSDLGPDLYDNGSAISRLWLSVGTREIVEQVESWLKLQQWHRDRGVPWKRGYGIHGPPGTGKTALVRAIAEDFDLPVYVFDLATLHNDELRENWTSMLSKMPCIALIEDIDSIFDGRKTLQGHLTFDCLLNCLDGVERSDGLLTFITTNNPEKLDPAIGGGDPNSMTTRPGRIDHVVRTGPLCKEGRIFLASRILQDAPEQLVHKVVSAGDGDTGAQFELRCVKAASSLIWGAGLSTVT